LKSNEKKELFFGRSSTLNAYTSNLQGAATNHCYTIEVSRLSRPKSSRNLSPDRLETKYESCEKNTSIAEIEGGSRDLRLSLMTIGNSSLIRNV